MPGGYIGLIRSVQAQPNQIAQVSAPSITRLTLFSIFIWVALSILFYFIGPYIIHFLLPFFSFILNFMSDNHVSVLSINTIDGNQAIQAVTTTIRTIQFTDNLILSPGFQVQPITNVIHNLVPLVIFYSVVLAWPGMILKERIILCLLGVPVSFIMLSILIPTILAGHIESQLLSSAEAQLGRMLETPFIMKLVVFMETGGRWLMPLIMLVLCKIFTTNAMNLSTPQVTE